MTGKEELGTTSEQAREQYRYSFLAIDDTVDWDSEENEGKQYSVSNSSSSIHIETLVT